MGDPETGRFPSDTSTSKCSALRDAVVPSLAVRTLTFGLMSASIVVFAALKLVAWVASTRYDCVIHSAGALYPPDLSAFQWYRLVLALFISPCLLQLVATTFSSVVVSFDLEEALGREKFFAVYFGSGVYGLLLFCVGDPSNMTSGCSAAVVGVTGAAVIRVLLGARKKVCASLAVFVVNLLAALLLPYGSFLVFIGGFVSGVLFTLVMLEETEGIPSMQRLKLWSKGVLIAYPIICIVGYFMLDIQYIAKC